MFILFVVKNDSNEEINIETMMMGSEDTSGVLHRLYNNETYKKAVKLWLHFLNKRGFLDTLITQDNQVVKTTEDKQTNDKESEEAKEE